MVKLSRWIGSNRNPFGKKHPSYLLLAWRQSTSSLESWNRKLDTREGTYA
jgi:hypothetical protein